MQHNLTGRLKVISYTALQLHCLICSVVKGQGSKVKDAAEYAFEFFETRKELLKSHSAEYSTLPGGY